ncbi:hypothetical protein [Marinobacter sp.]|jgi:hypothetical protein|uniref:DUF7936 family protein n=1 Tax=Marinobacter sp. TaxID=50741 RepID=UPI002352DBC1|nr:hypothetical protein [Marinobacter sp.]|tara:strand:- start:3499 stop:3840 length:342 start_codon:yes stop_codon:yes gene_type:complete
MAISYTWNVNTCDTKTVGSKSNVVHTVHWRLTGTDDSNNDADGNPQAAQVYGSQALDTSDLSSFILWSNLTASDVQGWVEAALGADKVTAMKASIDASIAEKVSPTSVTKVLS